MQNIFLNKLALNIGFKRIKDIPACVVMTRSCFTDWYITAICLLYEKGFVVNDGKKNVAYILLHLADYFAKIICICVHEDYSHKGIGKALIREAERYCRSHSIYRIKLHVRKDNTNAIGFYKKCGFRVREEFTYRSNVINRLKRKSNVIYFLMEKDIERLDVYSLREYL